MIQEAGYRPSTITTRILQDEEDMSGRSGRSEDQFRIHQPGYGRGWAGQLSERGYQMLLASTDNQADKEVMYMKIFENYPVDGIILIGTMITARHRKFLKESRVPVVVIGQYTRLANCVYHDDIGAGKAMGQGGGPGAGSSPGRQGGLYRCYPGR